MPVVPRAWQLENSEFTEKLPTRAFLVPLDEDEELTIELSKGNTITIKYKAISELQPNGTRQASTVVPPCVSEMASLIKNSSLQGQSCRVQLYKPCLPAA